jgi:hypothetical protein
MPKEKFLTENRSKRKNINDLRTDISDERMHQDALYYYDKSREN